MRFRMKAAGLLLSTALAAAMTLAAAQPAQADDPYFYQIVNFGSGKCAAVGWNGNGEPVTQQPCAFVPEQLWHPEYLALGMWRLVNYGGRCLDVRDGADRDRQPVQIWDCPNGNSKVWRIGPLPLTGVRQIVSNLNGLRCLDVAAGSLDDGAQIQIYHCTGFTNSAQVWSLQPFVIGPV